MSCKRAQGCYFTAGKDNPFALKPFRDWARIADLPNCTLLEPFAGRGDILRKLGDLKLCKDYSAYDIDPAADDVERRDTLLLHQTFPKGFRVCVTNPPWLARNSATRRGLPFPDCQYDDLYKFALQRCLDNCPYVAALIPESFLRAFHRTRVFSTRLHTFISLTAKLFSDTNHPTGLALFTKRGAGERSPCLYRDEYKLGRYRELQRLFPRVQVKAEVYFNKPMGNLGLFALDNTREASIRFCTAEEVKDYDIGASSRAITKIYTNITINSERITLLNRKLKIFREKTSDVFLTAYRGLRRDNMYRRRLDWALARTFILASH